jgi:hypothetical protein
LHYNGIGNRPVSQGLIILTKNSECESPGTQPISPTASLYVEPPSPARVEEQGKEEIVKGYGKVMRGELVYEPIQKSKEVI